MSAEPTTATLTLDVLHIFSEELADNFNQQITAAVADCRERPQCEDKRLVTIKLAISPHPDDADDVLIEPATKLSVPSPVPSHKLPAQRARRTRSDQLQFDFIAVAEGDDED